MTDLPANRDPRAREQVTKLRQDVTEIATALATLPVSTSETDKVGKEIKQITRALTTEDRKLDLPQAFDYATLNDLTHRVQLLRPQAVDAMTAAQQYAGLGALCLRYGVGKAQVEADPGSFSLKTDSLSSIKASSLTELQVRLEQSLASEQRKHDEYSADVKADLQRLLSFFEQIDITGFNDYRISLYRTVRAELHDVQLEFERANETVDLQPLRSIEQKVRTYRSRINSQVLELKEPPQSVVITPSRRPRWAVLGTGAMTVLSTAAGGTGLVAGIIDGGLVAGAAVLVPVASSALWGAALSRRNRPLPQPAPVAITTQPRAAIEPSSEPVRELPAPEAWTKRTLRALEAQAPSWAAALSPQRAAQLSGLLDEARITLTSGAVLSAGQMQQDELRKLLEEHLPTSLDSFLRLRMSIPSNRAEGEAELQRQLSMILIDLRRIADLSDEAVLSRQQEFGRYLDSALAISELNLHQPPKVEN